MAPKVSAGSRRDHRAGGLRRGFLAALATLCAACAAPDRPPALLPDAALSWLAADTVRSWPVGPGVRYHYAWSPRGPWAVHLVQADLARCELGLEVAAVDAAGGFATVSALVPRAPGRPLVAVNGDFFTPEGRPVGPEIVRDGVRSRRSRPGLVAHPGVAAPWIGTVRIQADSLVGTGWRIDDDDGGPPRVVGGFPELLDAGERVGDLGVGERPDFAGSRHPRTAVGFDPSSARLWLVVVDGRQGAYSTGMALPELTELLEHLGAREALNLDGGGSSVMVVRGRRVSRPSDAAGERPVVNALVVVGDRTRCQRSSATLTPTRNVRPGPGSK